MKNNYLLMMILAVGLVSSCTRSEFSASSRHYRNGKATYSNRHNMERVRSGKVKSPRNYFTQPEAQIQTYNSENLIASTGTEPAIFGTGELRGFVNNETVQANDGPDRIQYPKSLCDSVKGNSQKVEELKTSSKLRIIKFKNGQKVPARIISQSHDTLFYKLPSQSHVTRSVTMDKVDEILPDSRKIEIFGVVGFIASVLGLIGIVFAFLLGLWPFIAFPLSLIALLFGMLSLRRIRRKSDTYKGKGFAIVSFIFGVAGAILTGILSLILFNAFLHSCEGPTF